MSQIQNEHSWFTKLSVNTILNQLRKLALVISNGTILWKEKGQSSTSNTYLYSTLERALLCPDSTSLMNGNVWHSLMQHICQKRKKGTHICNDHWHCKCNFFEVTNVVINSWMGSGYTKIRIIIVNTEQLYSQPVVQSRAWLLNSNKTLFNQIPALGVASPSLPWCLPHFPNRNVNKKKLLHSRKGSAQRHFWQK